MYGVSKEQDWRFLEGRSLQQVCIGLYDVQLGFDGDVRISVNLDSEIHPFVIQSPEGSESVANTSDATYCALIRLLGRTVTAAEAQEPDELRLAFENGALLSLFDASKNYESFTITAPGITIVV